MYNGKKIKELMDIRQEPYRELLKALGMNPNQASINSIVNGNPKAERLEQVADYLEVPIDLFFIRKKQYLDPRIKILSEKLENLEKEHTVLQERMEEKDKLIKTQETLINILTPEEKGQKK